MWEHGSEHRALGFSITFSLGTCFDFLFSNWAVKGSWNFLPQKWTLSLNQSQFRCFKLGVRTSSIPVHNVSTLRLRIIICSSLVHSLQVKICLSLREEGWSRHKEIPNTFLFPVSSLRELNWYFSLKHHQKILYFYNTYPTLLKLILVFIAVIWSLDF